jgi:hypothetical protein
VFLIRRPKSEEDEHQEANGGSTELDEWTEFSSAAFEPELFAEYENMLDPEVQVATFANGVFDEADLGGLIPFGNIFSQ